MVPRLLTVALVLAAGTLALTGCSDSDTPETVSDTPETVAVTTAADTGVVETGGVSETGGSPDVVVGTNAEDPFGQEGTKLAAALEDAVTSGDEQAIQEAVDAMIESTACPACPPGTENKLREAARLLFENYPEEAARVLQAMEELPSAKLVDLEGVVILGQPQAIQEAVDAVIELATCPCPPGTQSNLEEAVRILENYPEEAARVQQAIDELPPGA